MTNQVQQELESIMNASFSRTEGQARFQQIYEATRAGMVWCDQRHMVLPRAILDDQATRDLIGEEFVDRALGMVVAAMAYGIYHDTYATDQVLRAAVAAIAPADSQ